MTGYSDYKARIARHMFPDIYQDMDGYWYWAPKGLLGGYSDGDLTMMGLLLAEANRKWDNEIKEYFRVNR